MADSTLRFRLVGRMSCSRRFKSPKLRGQKTVPFLSPMSWALCQRSLYTLAGQKNQLKLLACELNGDSAPCVVPSRDHIAMKTFNVFVRAWAIESTEGYQHVDHQRKGQQWATRLAEQMWWFSGDYLTSFGRADCCWCDVETPMKVSKSNQSRS